MKIPKINSVCSKIKTGYSAVAKKTGEIKTETLSTSSYYYQTVKNRWKVGGIVSKQKDFGAVKSLGTRIKSVVSGVKYKKEHLPTLLSLALLPTPVPSVAGYGVGKVINNIVSKFSHK